MASSIEPDTTSCPSVYMPISLAMAVAVSTWSPVIITVRIPASFAVCTATMLSGRGGSIIPIRPPKVRFDSSSQTVMTSGSLS
jgi:hypothetical protein